MSKSSAEGRQRVIETAASILSTRGLKGVSIREVAKLANAPLGSTYHHFPDGKVQIITEAIEWAGEKAAERLKGCLDKDNRNGLQTFLHQWRERLHRSNFQQGCPIVAAAIEASQAEDILVRARVEMGRVTHAGWTGAPAPRWEPRCTRFQLRARRG